MRLIFTCCIHRAKYKLGYQVGIFSTFYSHKIKPGIHEYEVENVMRIIKTAFPDLSFQGWGLNIDAVSLSNISKILNSLGINDSEKIIIIHPAVSKRNRRKMWPIENFIKLISKINEVFKVKIIIIGAKEEKAIILRIKKNMQNIFDLSGMLSLGELAGLIKRSNLFVGNNSGPLQMAVALDIPTVSLMGPSLFNRWAPKSDKHIVIQKKVDCIPCEGTNNKCNNNICMQMISAEEVFEAVKSRISG